VLLGVGSIQAIAQEQKPYVGSPEFEQMKQLVGSWEGMMDMGKESQKVTAHYRVTSGGSAIVETIFEGTPHEMMTVYHDDSRKRVTMTHYCMLGNQPKMTLKNSEGKMLEFELVPDSDIDAAHDEHMHAVTIIMNGQNGLTQEWSKSELEKPGEVVKISYSMFRDQDLAAVFFSG
jgi:hypothetical protein